MSGSTWIKILVIFLLPFSFNAQENLSIGDAIRIALEKNYGVLSMKNSKEIASVQNNLGAAGMSPTISLNGSITSSNLNSHQIFSTGTEQDRTGAKSNATNASINADWTVFDGMRMFAIKKRLELTEGLSAIQLKQQMENTVYEVVSVYFNVVRVNELIKAAKQNLSIYQERKKIALLRQEIGSDSKVEVLLSKSDENKAQSSIIALELELLQSKVKLNIALTRPVDTDFAATDSIVVGFNPSLEELKKSVPAGNSFLLMAKQNEKIFDQGVKEVRALSLPFITLNGAYIFSKSTSQAGLLFSNRQTGLNLGVTGRWNIFNGGRNNRLVKERNLLALNQRYFTEQTKLDIDAAAFISYQSFLLNKKIVDLEVQNLADSKEVQNISLERYRIGKANLLETIETQKNLEDAQVRYINALYNIKLAETDLLRANGSLVK
jgi:outer membrane protein